MSRWGRTELIFHRVLKSIGTKYMLHNSIEISGSVVGGFLPQIWHSNDMRQDLKRSRGLSWSPSNYIELGWKRYFLMSEWDQNGTRTSVAIDINTRLPSVAIMYPLWLPHSHNVADFCAFLTYFYHLSHTAVTVIIQTGPSRVPNLPHI